VRTERMTGHSAHKTAAPQTRERPGKRLLLLGRLLNRGLENSRSIEAMDIQLGSFVNTTSSAVMLKRDYPFLYPVSGSSEARRTRLSRPGDLGKVPHATLFEHEQVFRCHVAAFRPIVRDLAELPWPLVVNERGARPSNDWGRSPWDSTNVHLPFR